MTRAAHVPSANLGDPTDAPVFEARRIGFRYPTAPRAALRDLSLRIARGALCAVIGPNGSGKSTLLKLLVGALEPPSGQVLYQGLRLSAWGRRSFARHVGVVPQIEQPTFPLAAREIVAMGRYPHLGLLGRESAADRRVIADAMTRCDVLDLADRPFSTLSGGERQRVRIARALAQQPETLVLDEPTVSLDIQHEMEIFELLKELRADRATVVVVTHNLNLAARYAGQLLLLDQGELVAQGPPAEVLYRAAIERVYRWPVALAEHPGPGPDAGAPQVVPLAGRGVPSCGER